MIDLRWKNGELQLRHAIGIDVSGALCPGAPGEWETVRRTNSPNDCNADLLAACQAILLCDERNDAKLRHAMELAQAAIEKIQVPG